MYDNFLVYLCPYVYCLLLEFFHSLIWSCISGTTTGCTLGIIASFYSCIALGVTWIRDKEDTGNTFIAAATTGAIYKSTAGLRSIGLGAAVGLTLAGVYTLVTDNDNIWSKAKYNRLWLYRLSRWLIRDNMLLHYSLQNNVIRTEHYVTIKKPFNMIRFHGSTDILLSPQKLCKYYF